MLIPRLGWAVLCLTPLLFHHTAPASAAVAFDATAYTQAAVADRVTALPGLPADVANLNQLFFGYLTIPTGPSLFYGFAESKSRPATDPFVLWLNGGPGCSSLNGLFNELGPFWPTADGGLVENPWAWNAEANVLFLEAPAWAGFSTSTDPKDGDEPGDARTAHNNRLALLAFLERFPALRGRPFYISGESWAGHYVPQLAQAIVEGNKAEPQAAFNLKSILVGNPHIGIVNNERAYLTFMNAWGALDSVTYNTLINECMTATLDPFTTNFTDTCIATSNTADEEIGLGDGIDPYNILAPLCYQGQASLLQKQHRQDVSMLYKKVSTGGAAQARAATRRERGDAATSRISSSRTGSTRAGSTHSTAAVSSRRSLLGHKQSSEASHHIASGAAGRPQARGRLGAAYPEDPCVRGGVYLSAYLNKAAVQKALHIDASERPLPHLWVECNHTLSQRWDAVSRAESVQPVYAKLIEEGIPITLYSGDVDSVCAFSGVLEMAEQLQLPLADPAVRRRAWYLAEGDPVAQDTGGWVTEFKGLVHATVRGAGHMVPYDQPEKALYILTRTLHGEPL